jgi:hypothetical protein
VQRVDERDLVRIVRRPEGDNPLERAIEGSLLKALALLLMAEHRAVLRRRLAFAFAVPTRSHSAEVQCRRAEA